VTALVVACERGSLDIVRLLIKAGANIHMVWTMRDGTVLTLLAVATNQENVSMVKELIKSGANVNTEGGAGLTPLIYASFHNRPLVVKILIKAGAAVDCPSSATMSGVTAGVWPLAVACQFGHLETVRELINGGADVEKSHYFQHNNREMTAVFFAAVNGRMAVLKELVRAGATPQLLVPGFSPEERFMLLVKLLMGGLAKVAAASPDGAMLLRIACDKGFAGAVKMLLETGADVRAEGEDGVTPLEAACRLRAFRTNKFGTWNPKHLTVNPIP